MIIDKIPDWQARRFYRVHHSYRPELYREIITNHAVALDGELVGAISYAMPRRRSPLLGINTENIVQVARVCVDAGGGRVSAVIGPLATGGS